jgi:GT2 family glycosyltransferase
MEKVGYFDKKTFLFYEDLIITEKMQKKRIKCVYYPGLQAIHIHSATTRKVNWREIEKYHHESNKYYLYKYKNISEYGMAMIDISEIIWENTWLHIKTIINNLNSVMSHYELNKSN